MIRECLLAAVFVVLTPPEVQAYSQFTHEELIDLAWAESIRPLLVQRYPQSSEAALSRAHAFAYGGSLIQDIGYYPFGNRFFSDLAHYVRSGDFVISMIRNARTLDELAFAIGALSHYIGDSIGHSQAINPATADEFPELEKRYGRIVTYEEAPLYHVRTEFGFDVAESAFQRYAPRRYRKRIGFRVSRPLLYRAFRETYGMPARGILGPVRTGLPSYRWSITRLLPAFLGAEIVRLRRQLPLEPQDGAETEFESNVSNSQYAARYAGRDSRTGAGAHVLAAVLTVIPKIGVLKILSIKAPLPVTEGLFLASADRAVSSFRDLLASISRAPDLKFELVNLDLDTGNRVLPGQSAIVDRTFAKLLLHVVQQRASPSAELKKILLDYYRDSNAQAFRGYDDKLARRVNAALTALRAR